MKPSLNNESLDITTQQTSVTNKKDDFVQENLQEMSHAKDFDASKTCSEPRQRPQV
jgi:hypothetical protein